MSTSTDLSDEDAQKLQEKILERLVRNGQWAKLQKNLKAALVESGYIDQLRTQAAETARQINPLEYQSLEIEVRQQAFQLLPEEVKQKALQDVTKLVHSQLDGNGNLSTSVARR